MDQPNAISETQHAADKYAEWLSTRTGEFFKYQPTGGPLYPREVPGSPIRVAPFLSRSIDDYWTVLWRHKLVLFAFLAACALFGAALTLLLPAVYQASIALEFQGWNDNTLKMVTIDPVMPAEAVAADVYIQTKIELFKSRSLLEGVNRTLAAQQWTEPPTVREKLLTAWRKLPKRPVLPSQARLIAAAAESVKVTSVRGTRIIKVQCESSVPALAAAYVNTLAEEFILRNEIQKGQNSQWTASSLNRQLVELRQELERSEDALQGYARKQGLVMTSENDNAAEDRLKQLQSELSRAQAERIAAQSRLEVAATARPESLGEVLDNGPLREYQAKLTELRRQLAESSAMYTPNFPKVKQIQAQIKELAQTIQAEHNNVVSRIRKDFDAGTLREQLLISEFIRQQKLTADQANEAIRYGVLKHNVDSYRRLYEAMLQKVKEVGITSAIQGRDIRIVDSAAPPEMPIRPNVFLNASLSLVTGVVLGVTFIFVRERRDQRLRKPGDSVQCISLPELGVIPADPMLEVARSDRIGGGNPGLSLRAAWDDSRMDGVEAATWPRVGSEVSESFRSVLVSLLCNNPTEPRRRIVVASPNAGEGKTTAVSQIGITLARINHKVLLIDADVCKPRLHTMFGLSNSTGLTDFLVGGSCSGDASLSNFIRPTKVPRLHVLTSGSAGGAVPDILDWRRISELLQLAEAEFDFVLIDTPPILASADARIWGRLANGVVLVFRAGRTDRTDAVAAAERLASDGVVVIGSILNACDPRLKGYYSYQYRGQKS